MTQDWMKFYFLDPQPERFVQEVRQLSADGILAHPERSLPAVTFLSRVIAANPDRLSAWLDALCDLPKADLRNLEIAAWLSGAPEAGARLVDSTLDPLFAETPPDVLEREIDHPIILDALWAYYFATGELQAVRRIISTLEHMSDFGAAKSFRETQQTNEDKARALRDGMFQAASWSLESLMREHAPLKQFCGELVRSGNLTSNERCALAIVLSRIDPDIWRVDIDPRTSRATIAWKDGSPLPKEKKPWWRPW